ncbi:hypothetical protein [Nocardia blacklockiae]|uniref:hypothetical protein n=1 Tax=Nocardia blacklockiae TaxID=480036 RepID=UPI001892D5DF|nr:hypothetical protein [Nocardia blacklockiae]MBF6172121.1 hypothetical protein [Nocardia blacklockiae]
MPAAFGDTRDPIAEALTALGPAGWQRVEAVFAMTIAAEVGNIVYVTVDRTISVPPPESVLRVVREQRAAAARSERGPWWRISLVLNDSGATEVHHDYGEEPFPPGQLFEPQAYRADLSAYPRARLPVWLAAYLGHGERQRRTPRQAAEQERADRSAKVWARLAENEFPPFPAMWARWATIAAAFVATGSRWGPRMLPWTGVFEGAGHHGSSLHALPGGRAVLSGGVWDAPALDAAYNEGGPIPNLYAGAPHWVCEPVLNARLETGLLSFCYWWESGHWYRGESPGAADCATAVPGMWSADTVSAVVTSLIPADRGDRSEAVAALVAAAEAGAVTRAGLADVFGDGERVDLDGALHQFELAGLALPETPPMPAAEAVSRVRDYITGMGLDTTGYPLAQLTSRRFSVGWMVYVPPPEGTVAIGRAVFYVGDDGVLELSSSVEPETYVADFERRFAERHGAVA